MQQTGTELAAAPLTIDVVSDVVCPWCIIGYLQLMKALDSMPGQFDTTIRWHPFELNPGMPPEGQHLGEHLAQKYGASAARGDGARARLVELGDSLGFHFDYYEGMRMANTFRAHQLLHWAGIEGDQTALKLALFASFFTHREDVNDIDTLVEVVIRAGQDGDAARAVLADERFAAEVREAEAYWREQDVYAVPMFVLQGQYPVPGAQEADTFVRVLTKIQSRDT